VQLAISQKKMLGHLNGRVVPFVHSESMAKAELATQHAWQYHGEAEAAWDTLRSQLLDLLASSSTGEVPIANLKRILRRRFRSEFSEVALGHLYLSECLQDPRLHDVCEVKLAARGYVIVAAKQLECSHPMNLNDFDKLPASAQDHVLSMPSMSGLPGKSDCSPRPAVCTRTASPASHRGLCSSPSRVNFFPDTPSPCALHHGLLLGPASLAGSHRASDVAEPARVKISLTSSILSEVKPKPRLQLANLLETSAGTDAATDGRRYISLFDSLHRNMSLSAHEDSSPKDRHTAAAHEGLHFESRDTIDSHNLSPMESSATTLYASTPSPLLVRWADLQLHGQAPDGADMLVQGAVQRSLCSLFDNMAAELNDQVQCQHTVGMDVSCSPALSQSPPPSSTCCGYTSSEAGDQEELVVTPSESSTSSHVPPKSTTGALPRLLGRTRVALQACSDKQSFQVSESSDTEVVSDSSGPDPHSNLTDFSVSLRNTFLHASPLRMCVRSRARSLPWPTC